MSSSAGAETNAPPRIIEVDLQPRQPRRDESLHADVRVTDREDDAITLQYEWRVDGELLDESGATLAPWHLDQAQTVSVTVRADDGLHVSAPQEASIRFGNQPPMMIGIRLHPQSEIRTDSDVVARATASDPDGDLITYHYAWWVNGRQVDNDTDTLPAAHLRRGDEIQVSVVATDGNAESESLQTEPVQVENSPPRIVSQPRGFGADGIFRYPIEIDDADGDTRFTYRVIEGPDGMAIDGLDGQMIWKPRDSQAGTHTVKLEVSDRHGGKATQSFQLQLAFEETAVPAAGDW